MPSTDPIFSGLSSYWVLPGRLLAGAHPGFTSASQAPEAVQALTGAGVEVFLDLTQTGEAIDYEPFLRGPAVGSQPPRDYRRLGFRDMSVPTPQQMVVALDLVDSALAVGRAAYVHCLGGLGRTGMVVGCHLVRHGLDGEDALDRIVELRQQAADAFSVSPVTDAQRRFVAGWRVGS